jgi:hypothetical protein
MVIDVRFCQMISIVMIDLLSLNFRMFIRFIDPLMPLSLNSCLG